MSETAPTSAADSPPPAAQRRVLGSWIVPVVLIGGAAGWLFVLHRRWEAQEAAMQTRNLTTLAIVLGAGVLAFAWFLFLSRTALRVRLGALFTVLFAGLVGLALFEPHFTGDMRLYFTRRRAALEAPVTNPVNATASRDAAKDDARAPAAAAPQDAAEFTQFRGNGRDGVIHGVTLARDWEKHPPRQLWRREVGAGWSGFAVAGRLAITQEQRGEEEMVIAYDLASGAAIWSHADPARYDTTIAGVGPRATPTIDTQAGRVYTLGATGVLNCLKLATGERVWSADICKDANASPLEWGNSGSPLLVDGRVVVNPGGQAGWSVVAYDAVTGRINWHAGDDRASYASPMVATLAGHRQIVMLNQTSVTGHDIETGRVLWSHDWPGNFPKVAQPLVIGEDRLFISAGYGVGCQLLKFGKTGDAFTVNALWKNIQLKAKFANSVLHEGHLYGLNDGTLVCLNAADGERTWRGPRYGHGQMLLVDDVLLVQTESGAVTLVEARPDEFSELTRFVPLTDNTWNSPTLAGRYLLVRSAHEAACFELAK